MTGAAGNLGGMLARHLLPSGRALRLMVRRTPVAQDLADAPNVTVVQADLARPETLRPAVEGAETVVHFAGVLFK
ncbi:MAG: NAD-dependent epimerase/dehydratase family protein, partial [Planctomycetota bacterium]